MPLAFTVSCFPGMNVAVTERSALIVSAHDPVPEQAPDQPLKNEPTAGVAASVTGVLSAKSCEQIEPQATPVGLLAIEPEPATTGAVAPK